LNTDIEDDWLYTISSKRKLIDFNFNEFWQYKDLLFLFVKRDIITLYKQTILGPLWYLLQPLFTSLIFTLIFNNLADIPTFKKNEKIFGKVYFPRVIMPMSVVVSNLLKFGIQIGVFIGFYVYFVWFTSKSYNVSPNFDLVFSPVLVLLMALLGLGLGMIISSMTTKYRDLTFLVQFGVQLFIVEAFRTMVFGTGELNSFKLIYAAISSCFIFLIGLVIFNKTEKSFIDTI